MIAVIPASAALAGCGLFNELRSISDSGSEVSGKNRLEREWVDWSLRNLSVSLQHKLSVRTDAIDAFEDGDLTNQLLRFKKRQVRKN